MWNDIHTAPLGVMSNNIFQINLSITSCFKGNALGVKRHIDIWNEIQQVSERAIKRNDIQEQLHYFWKQINSLVSKNMNRNDGKDV